MKTDQLRPDIAQAAKTMGWKLGSKREVKRLAEYLDDNEMVERMLGGQYANGTGLVVLTNQRVLFIKHGVMSQTTEEFRFSIITSIGWHGGVALGTIRVSTPAGPESITQVDKAKGKDFVDAAKQHVYAAS